VAFFKVYNRTANYFLTLTLVFIRDEYSPMAKAQVKQKISRKTPIKLLKKKKPLITRTKDLPVTLGDFLELRKLIEMESRASKKRFSSQEKRFESIDKRFESIDKRFESIDKRFESMDKRFDAMDRKMEAGFSDIKAGIQRMLVLMEEQNNRNKYVLDGHTALNDRMDRLESSVDERLKDMEDVLLIKKGEA